MKACLLLIVSTFALLLQGCIATAIVSAIAVGAKSAIDPRTIGTQVDDNTLKLRINRALLKDEQLKKAIRINVITYQGKVLLVGQTSNLNLADRAKQIAMGVIGTSEVFNEIRYNKPINLSTYLSDIWITMEVYSRLLISDQVKLSNIKVITENSEVFLLGIVTEREGKAAANIASHARAVKRITTAFTYIN